MSPDRRFAPVLKISLLLVIVLTGFQGTVTAQLPAWAHHHKYQITNPNGIDLVDYQVPVQIDHRSLVAGGYSNADGSDFRFAGPGGKLLHYWIEGGLGTDSCRVWVKLPSLPSRQTVSMQFYFGNPQALPGSNGDSTFVLFDDFSGTALDTTRWMTHSYYVDAGGAATVANGQLTVASGATSQPPRTELQVVSKSYLTTTGPVKIRERVKTPEWGGTGLGSFRDQRWTVNYPGGGYGVGFSTSELGFHGSFTGIDFSTAYAPASFLATQIDCFPDSARLFLGTVRVSAGAASLPMDSLQVMLEAGNSSSLAPQGMLVCDWIFVARAAPVEPVVTMPESGLIAYFPFDGSVTDKGPDSLTASVIGVVTPAPDRFGKASGAMYFDGNTGYVNVPFSFHPLGNASFSYAVWIKPYEEFYVGWRNIVMAGSIGTGKSSQLMLEASLAYSTMYTMDTLYSRLYYVPPDSEWTHMVLTKNRDSVTLYVNGRNYIATVLGGQKLVSTRLQIGGSISYLEGANYTKQFFHGSIDDVRIYGRALTPAEADSLFHERGWAPLPAAPQLVSPPPDSLVLSTRVRFVWARPDTTSWYYQLFLARDTSFLFPIFGLQTGDTTGTVSLSDTSTYYWRVRAYNQYGWGKFSPTRVVRFAYTLGIEGQPGVPSVFSLGQNFPNPFNPSTVIRFDVPRAGRVILTVYDVLGRLVNRLVDEMKQPGTYSVTFDAGTHASGVYFYRFEGRSFVATRKMLLLR